MMKLSRRRFLGHVLGAGLVSAAAYGTYRGFVPGYPKIHLDYPGMDLGHAMRDALIKRPVNIPSTDVNVLIAGSGGAGLSAAWALSKQVMHDYVVLDGPERNGNNRGEQNYGVTYPTGAHYLPLPAAESPTSKPCLAIWASTKMVYTTNVPWSMPQASGCITTTNGSPKAFPTTMATASAFSATCTP